MVEEVPRETRQVTELLKEKGDDLRFLSYFFGAIIVAVLAFVAWLIFLLSGNWCKVPLGVETAAKEQRTNNVTAQCFELLHEQIHGLTNIAYVLTGTISIGVVTYVVIVWAGARFSGSVGAAGVNAEIERN
mgnify:CR=1 FL=1